MISSPDRTPQVLNTATDDVHIAVAASDSIGVRGGPESGRSKCRRFFAKRPGPCWIAPQKAQC